MKILEIREGNPIGEGRWRVGHRTLDEVVETLRTAGQPLSETILHLERLKWRETHPSPKHRLVKPSKKQTMDDLLAGRDAGVLVCDYHLKWWFVPEKLGLPAASE